MKIRLIVIILIGLFLGFFKLYSQSIKGTDIPKVSVADNNASGGLSCLDKLNTGIEFSNDLWILMLGVCNTAFPSDPAGLNECEILANDTNTAMLQTYLNAYNRCSEAYN